MTTLQIEVPEELQSLIEKQITARGYSDISTYVQDLLQADIARGNVDEEYDEELEQMLLEGMKGPSKPWTKQTMADIRQKGLARIELFKK